MNILALETTEAVGTVAALSDGNLLAELTLNPRQRSAQSLAPGLESLLAQTGWKLSHVNLVAVTIGPGSFTGLRVGVTAAKMLAFCAGCDILGIDTLEAIAARAPGGVGPLSVAVDAQRGQVVAGLFLPDSHGWRRPVEPAQLVDVDTWLDTLMPGTHAAGPILRKISSRIPDSITTLGPEYWSPTAAWVGLLAARDHQLGRRDDLWALVPRYSRRSAAEEKWEARQKDPP